MKEETFRFLPHKTQRVENISAIFPAHILKKNRPAEPKQNNM